MSVEELAHRIKTSAYLDESSPMTAYEWLKVVLMLPTVLPRLLLAFLALGQLNLLSYALTLGIDPLKPMDAWRSRMVRQNARGVSTFLLWVVGFWTFTVKGREHLVKGDQIGAIAVFSHMNYIDPLVLIQLVCPAFISKSGVAMWFLVGRIAIAMQVLFVSRRATPDKRNPYSVRGRTTDVIRDRYVDAGGYPMLAMAPEATTKARECILTFQTGAFVLGRPVVPVCIRYPYKHFNPGWGLLDGRIHCLRLMTQFRNHLEVEVLPVYYPSEAERKDPRLYADNVRVLMAKTMGIPLVEQTVTDCTLLQKAGVEQRWSGQGVFFNKQASK